MQAIPDWTNLKSILVGWPSRPDTWRCGGRAAQLNIIQLIDNILKYSSESILLAADPHCVDDVIQQVSNAITHKKQSQRIFPFPVPADDCWFRDTGPLFVRYPPDHPNGRSVPNLPHAMCFRFNAWGGAISGCYTPYDQDEQFSARLSTHLGLPSRKIDFILEGGSIHVDGQGTAIVTEQCLLNANRNPTFSKADIEEVLGDHLGITELIWLPQGLAHDVDTDGHVDNIAVFIRRGHVLLAWSDEGPNASRCAAALQILSQATDAQGCRLTVHKVHQPPPVIRTVEEANGVVAGPHNAMARVAGERLCASYVNILQTNNAVLVPMFGASQEDERAMEQIRQASQPTTKKFVAIHAREFVLAGGGIHCLTLGIPSFCNK